MKSNTFPWIAAGIGLVLALVLLRTAGMDGGEPRLPRLTLMFMSEFGFLVTLGGGWFGGRAWLADRHQLKLLLVTAACLLMAVAFLYLGVVLWSDLAPVAA